MPTRRRLKRLMPGASRLTTCVVRTPYGWIELSASPRGLTSTVLPRTANGPAKSPSQQRSEVNRQAARWLNQARRELQAYFLGKSKSFTCPVDLSGATPFQRAVWRATAQVPYGRVRSYQWIAAKLGAPRSARAVGNALGANPVPLLIPCHRIVAGDASLGGFSCGLPWKRRLLKLEGSLRQLSKK